MASIHHPTSCAAGLPRLQNVPAQVSEFAYRSTNPTVFFFCTNPNFCVESGARHFYAHFVRTQAL